MLSIGAVFSIFGGFVYWFPIMTGVTLHERWSKAQFLIIFTAVNITFFPQHFLGLAGMPRRYSDYPDAYYKWNQVSSFGSLLSIFAVLMFIFLLWERLQSQRGVLFSRAPGLSRE